MLVITCLLVLGVTTVFSLPTTESKKCYDTLSANNITMRFAGVVAHGIHSMTVEELRQFEKDVTENNIVPTVNMDLKSDKPILLNAPATKWMGKVFQTDSMRVVDQVLSHMDDKKFDIKGRSALERLVHALHMREVWYRAQKLYQKVKENPPTSAVCACIRDVNNNGILNVLRFIALVLREPELMYGKHTTWDDGDWPDDWPATIYIDHFLPKNPENLELPKPKDAIPHLKNQAGWQEWKKLMMHDNSNKENIHFNSAEEANDDYYLAMYLYCALNAPKIN